MSYSTKYYAKILDLDLKTVTINLKKKSYGGSATQITHYPVNPLQLNYRANQKDDDESVHGSECNFTFYSLASDNDKYDELFESELRDWQVEIIKQQNSLIDTPIDLQSFENIGSGVDWSNYSTSGIQSTVTSFFGAPSPTKRAIYPMYVQSGETVAVDVEAHYIQGTSPTATVTFTVSLMDETKAFIIGSSVATTITEPTTTINTTVVLTATTANAYYISVQGLYNPDGSGTSDCTIRYTVVRPAVRDFAPAGFWYGWVQPDYLSRRFVTDAYFISLTATDGLAELKDIDYPVALIEASGTTTAINVIKNILNETDLPLPIISQLNYRTNTITGSDSFLSNIYLNTNRFLKSEKDGRKQYMNCLEALEYVLDSFYSRISQSNAVWEIVQKNEIVTPLTTFDWDTLSFTRTNRDRLLNIDSYRSKIDSDELTKIRPIKTINLTYFNKNAGESTVGNGTFDTDISGWNNSSDGGFGYYELDTFEWEAGRLHVESIHHNGAQSYFESDPFYLDNLGLLTGATLDVSVDYEYASTEYSSSFLSFITFSLMSGSTVISSNLPLNLSNIVGSVGTKATVKERLKYSLSGNYSIRVNVSLPFSLDGIEKDAEFYFDNVSVVQKYETKATYDKLYKAELAGAQFGKKQVESSLYFSQGLQANDVGNLKYNNTTGLTTIWSNHDSSVLEESHQFLYCYEKMRQFRFFKDFLKITLKANSEIGFNTILELDDKKYTIVGYNYSLQTGDMTLNLAEIIESTFYEFTLDFEYVQDLTSIDGESSE